jgi:type II secretory pathway component GspD/PulD (secretin)
MPLIKHLFRGYDREYRRTELVLFLTPLIVTDNNQLEAFTEQITALYSGQGG